jgi:tol-pal system protein YbgF
MMRTQPLLGTTIVRLVLAVILTAQLSGLALAAPQQPQDTSRRLYDRVMAEYNRKDYEAALAGFRFFLALHSQTSLAANAQYWVGECQYRLGRYKDALASFYNVVSYHPLSQKLASSTLRIGQAHAKLGEQEKARMMYDRVLLDYPSSPEAEVARKAIEQATATSEPTPSGN